MSLLLIAAGVGISLLVISSGIVLLRHWQQQRQRRFTRRRRHLRQRMSDVWEAHKAE